MEVEVNYFGMIAEKLNKQTEKLNFPEHCSDIKSYMSDMYPTLKSMTYTVAIDQELKNEYTAGDGIREIAILPPFAGG